MAETPPTIGAPPAPPGATEPAKTVEEPPKRQRQQSQAVAKQIKKKANEAAQRARNLKRGRVVRVSPLKVELFADDRVLTEDEDLEVSQWVRFYDKEYGIGRGDTALVMRESGEWTMFDLESDTDLDPRWLVRSGGDDGGDPSHDHR